MNDLISRSNLIKRINNRRYRPSATIPVPAVVEAIKAEPPVEFQELERIVQEEREELKKWGDNT